MALLSRWTLRHPLSLLGASIVSVSGVLILFYLVAGLLGFETNPYLGLLVFLALPAILVAGLVLIPLGTWLDARRSTRSYPVLDINRSSHRVGLMIFLALTAVNLVLVSAAAFKGAETMESPEFCGQVCHKVMHPEYTAWQWSPHARVPCSSCHIGPGARGFVQAKLNGVHQLVSIMTGEYARPIPTPVEGLRPARETCEQCHWPSLGHGDRVKVRKTFLEDEANTEQRTVMVLKIGGGGAHEGDEGSGIHWHMNLASEITYVATDATRQTIPWMRLTDREGKVTEYLAPDAKRPSEAEIEERGRTMDCVDCHNRPAHRFLTAGLAVDDAIASGRIPRDLPYVKKIVMASVTEDYQEAAAAEQGITSAITRFYEEAHPEIARDRASDVGRAAREAVLIRSRNVFPGMGITWGAYPSMIGHTDVPGCFRCHDGEHVDGSGKAITNDCDACHTLMAVEETDPAILGTLPP